MKTYDCNCGNRIFFENSLCVACGGEVGWCPACRRMVTLNPDGERLRCGNEACRAALVKCANYALEDVCNRCVAVADEGGNGAGTAVGDDAELESSGALSDQETLCDYCLYTRTIPDLSVEANRQRWYQLEVAKRRLLYALDMLCLPYGSESSGFWFPLSFDFKTDAPSSDQIWRTMGEHEQVYTGHAEGRITINVREADDAERERLRVDFQEAHRTLIGHFRHEIGHYYWQVLVENKCEPEFKALFGDHENPPYSEAMAQYYAEGPGPNWHRSFISAYASMHPWEDFAEVFATYLDMVSVLDTARNMGLGGPGIHGDFEPMVEYYRDLGIVVNEMNRAMGLVDLVPEVFFPPILEKMKFISDLVTRACQPPSSRSGTVT
jgi:hypothetical protein